MSNLILLIVGAIWFAVLLPPLINAKIKNSPSTSVSQFQRKINSLQNSSAVNSRSHMRGMSRELAPNRQNRQSQSSGGSNRFSSLTGPILRPQGTRSHQNPRAEYIARQVKRQRQKQNVIVLGSSTFISLFLALSTGVMLFVWAFTLSLIGLIFYCYILVQSRISRDNQMRAARFRQRSY